ncbi:hypothetical protein MAR_016887 [Mya arenaria]|uniref:Uncharacterized protein n=1 Tax=Mya arenaria TaxID=6604 RepID=A0ABY7ECP3_MYAAR|nr:hypothetical protein MAR_016887 [Mya arenaria]
MSYSKVGMTSGIDKSSSADNVLLAVENLGKHLTQNVEEEHLTEYVNIVALFIVITKMLRMKAVIKDDASLAFDVHTIMNTKAVIFRTQKAIASVWKTPSES